MSFHESCMVHMADNNKKYIKDIVIGDIVLTPYGPDIVTKLTTHDINKHIDIVDFATQLKVTYDQQIYFGLKWQSAINIINNTRNIYYDSVFINDMQCSTKKC